VEELPNFSDERRGQSGGGNVERDRLDNEITEYSESKVMLAKFPPLDNAMSLIENKPEDALSK
jgi:hypothetical protein